MLSPNGMSKRAVHNPHSVIQLLSKETSGGLQSKLLLKGGSTLNSDEVAQGFVHLSLEYLQGWGSHSLPGAMLHCPVRSSTSCHGNTILL